MKKSFPLFDIFEHVPMGPSEPIFEILKIYRRDTFEGKADLGIGVYRDENEKPYKFQVVKEVEEELLKQPHNKVRFY